MPRFVMILLCLALVDVPDAAAQATNAPPGNSGVSQYLESIPAATGNKTPAKGGGRPVSAKTERALRASGPSGRALAKALTVAPGPPAAQAASNTKTGGNASNKHAVSKPAQSFESSSQQQPSTPAALAAPLGGDSGPSGSGLLLPIFLVVTALAAFGLGARRSSLRRTRS